MFLLHFTITLEFCNHIIVQEIYIIPPREYNFKYGTFNNISCHYVSLSFPVISHCFSFCSSITLSPVVFVLPPSSRRWTKDWIFWIFFVRKEARKKEEKEERWGGGEKRRKKKTKHEKVYPYNTYKVKKLIQSTLKKPNIWELQLSRQVNDTLKFTWNNI